jgi:hypothetical protein
MTVKELIEKLEDYYEEMEVVIATVNGQREIGSVDSIPIFIEDHPKEGMDGVVLFTLD